MKLVILATALMIPLAAGAESWIGIYENPAGDPICYEDISVGPPRSVYILGWAPESEFPQGVTAAEFRVDNLPPNGPEHGGIITETWTSDVTLGELGWDFSIAWATPQSGPLVLIGQLDFMMVDPAWIGDDHVMEIMAGNVCDCMMYVDHLFEAHLISISGWFTWNCTGECGCFWFVPARDSSWTEVKALY